jgi:hypothetical protein
MRAVLLALASATACAPSEPPSSPATPPANVEAGPPTSQAKDAPVANRSPKDNPASCVDPSLAAVEEWNEKQRAALDAELQTKTTCHQKATKRNPALEGKLRLFLHYQKGASKPKVDIAASSIADCELAACIRRLAERAVVHATPPETSFTYTLEFKPRVAATRSNDDAPIEGRHCVTSKSVAGQGPSLRGRLPPAVIQGIVRDSYDKPRACYEKGLERDPTLTGRVLVRFVIERDGSVSKAGVSANDLPDCDVTRCVVQGFRNLRFPKPEGGIVTVVYPIMFSPG